MCVCVCVLTGFTYKDAPHIAAVPTLMMSFN